MRENSRSCSQSQNRNKKFLVEQAFSSVLGKKNIYMEPSFQNGLSKKFPIGITKLFPPPSLSKKVLNDAKLLLIIKWILPQVEVKWI